MAEATNWNDKGSILAFLAKQGVRISSSSEGGAGNASSTPPSASKPKRKRQTQTDRTLELLQDSVSTHHAELDSVDCKNKGNKYFVSAACKKTTQIGPYCAECSKAAEGPGLIVRESTHAPGQGLGLYAARNFTRGTIIDKYEGYLVKKTETEKESYKSSYVMELPDDEASEEDKFNIDAKKTTSCYARYANHADAVNEHATNQANCVVVSGEDLVRGVSDAQEDLHEKFPGYTGTLSLPQEITDLSADDLKKTLFLLADQNIKAQEEILIDFGTEFFEEETAEVSLAERVLNSPTFNDSLKRTSPDWDDAKARQRSPRKPPRIQRTEQLDGKEHITWFIGKLATADDLSNDAAAMIPFKRFRTNVPIVKIIFEDTALMEREVVDETYVDSVSEAEKQNSSDVMIEMEKDAKKVTVLEWAFKNVLNLDLSDNGITTQLPASALVGSLIQSLNVGNNPIPDENCSEIVIHIATRESRTPFSLKLNNTLAGNLTANALNTVLKKGYKDLKLSVFKPSVFRKLDLSTTNMTGEDIVMISEALTCLKVGKQGRKDISITKYKALSSDLQQQYELSENEWEKTKQNAETLEGQALDLIDLYPRVKVKRIEPSLSELVLDGYGKRISTAQWHDIISNLLDGRTHLPYFFLSFTGNANITNDTIFLFVRLLYANRTSVKLLRLEKTPKITNFYLLQQVHVLNVELIIDNPAQPETNKATLTPRKHTSATNRLIRKKSDSDDDDFDSTSLPRAASSYSTPNKGTPRKIPEAFRNKKKFEITEYNFDPIPEHMWTKLSDHAKDKLRDVKPEIQPEEDAFTEFIETKLWNELSLNDRNILQGLEPEISDDSSGSDNAEDSVVEPDQFTYRVEKLVKDNKNFSTERGFQEIKKRSIEDQKFFKSQRKNTALAQQVKDRADKVEAPEKSTFIANSLEYTKERIKSANNKIKDLYTEINHLYIESPREPDEKTESEDVRGRLQQIKEKIRQLRTELKLLLVQQHEEELGREHSVHTASLLEETELLTEESERAAAITELGMDKGAPDWLKLEADLRTQYEENAKSIDELFPPTVGLKKEPVSRKRGRKASPPDRHQRARQIVGPPSEVPETKALGQDNGLRIKEMPEKGVCGVVAAKPFTKGEYVCDYPGDLSSLF